MTWVGWTYIWTIMALTGMTVRTLVLRGNLRDNRILKDPRINASKLMKRIAFGQLRVSAVLAFISTFNVAIGVLGLIEIYTHDTTGALAQAAGWALILFLIFSEGLLTVIAYLDLRVRRGPLE